MKKILLIIAGMILVVGLSAQDFAPSQQAQGYLDSKNVTVDYATGLFHYKVPVYTLKSGDFELPVSLNYVGKGVKREDVPGLIGYNWTLNTGGVVTRTIRGGMADEEPEGYIYQNFSDPPTAAQIEAVNKRQIDGESDIFTAVFCGQTIHFIIKTNNNQIVAEPLERTNIKIEIEQEYTDDLDGWIITDEYGTKYYFRQKEWSVDIIKEDAISFNGVRGRSYISSWYISKIEPQNCEPIIYYYKADVKSYGGQENVNMVRYDFFYDAIYHYGKAMRNRPFDFSKYRSRFEKDIALAKSYLNAFSIEMQINNCLYNLDRNGNFVRNPNFEMIADNIYANHRVMGQLADMTGLGSASSDLIYTLNLLIDDYYDIGSPNAARAASYLNGAKHTIIQCFDEKNNISTQKTFGGSSFMIKSPLLDKIICNDKVAKFYYCKSNPNKQVLERIKIEDIAKNNIVTVQLSQYQYLTQLSFIGRDSVEFDRIKFDYYGDYGPSDYTYDIWGFPKKERSDFTDYQFLQNVDHEYSKIKSLSKITTTDRGEIIIDYESNEIPGFRGFEKDTFNFGGIRIKSIAFKDPVTGIIDSVRYLYPYPGGLVFTECNNLETVSYSGFSDRITYSRAKNKGSAFLNTGNNGVYYSYIEEEFIGKGKKTYLFFNPSRLFLPSQIPYRFWLNALPLGIATYDKNGNLKSCTRNYYWADIESLDLHQHFIIKDIYRQGNWFSVSSLPIKYLNSIPQIKAYEYYMDYDQLSSYYQNQSNVTIYCDRNSCHYINPYNEIFLPNIEPRTSVNLPEQSWNLIYGGKILLKSREEYTVEGNYATESSVNHFITTDLGTPFRKTEFFYDNISNSTTPTRISKTDFNGDTYTTVIRRVCDTDIQGVLSDMKLQNIQLPVVKQQNLKNDKLLNEIVHVYNSSVVNDQKYFGRAEQKSYIPMSDIFISTFPAIDHQFFTYGEQNYTSEKETAYIHHDQQYIQDYIVEKGDTLTLYHDFSIDVPIIRAKGNYCNYLSAVNSHICNLEYDSRELSFVKGSYRDFLCADDIIKYIEQQNISYEDIQYMDSQRYKTVKEMIKCIVTKCHGTEYSEFKKYRDSLYVNNEWTKEFENICSKYITREHPLDKVSRSLYKFRFPQYYTESYYSCLRILHLLNEERSVSVNVSSTTPLNLYILSKDFTGPVQYSVTHAGGVSTNFVDPVSRNRWNVQVLSIGLSSYSGVTSVTVDNIDSRKVAFLALVPEECEFEATCYNTDGTIFCKFDQNSQMERYEYDGAGRVVRVFDQNNRLLKENTYNVVFQ